MARMVGTSRCDVPARVRRAERTMQDTRVTTLVAPLNAARTAQRAVPTKLHRLDVADEPLAWYSFDMQGTQRKPDGDRCRNELMSYIDDLDQNIVNWYQRDASKYYGRWFFWFWVSILAGFAASVIAAFVKGGALKDYGPSALIILPLLGSLAGVILSQFHYRELEDLREQGRIEAQDIVDWARGQVAAANTEEKCLAIYEELRGKVKELELWQHKDFTKITTSRKSLKSSKD